MRHFSCRTLTQDGANPTTALASANDESRAGEAVYTLRLFAASGAAAGVQRLSACSDERAISDAIRRLKDEAAVDVWRGDEWLCRCERATAGCAPVPRLASTNRRRGAVSGWARRRSAAGA